MKENNQEDKYFQYITERLIDQIKYYRRKSSMYQKEYHFLSITNIVILSFIPFFTLLSDYSEYSRYIIAASSAVASILSGTLLLRKTKDNWLEFRATEESLKSELEEYLYSVGQYSNLTNDAASKLLVEQCEKIMRLEHTQWLDRMKKESTQT